MLSPKLVALVLLMTALLGACAGGIVLEVTVEHRLRCVLVKRAGRWHLTTQETVVPLEECRHALERVLTEWETP